MANTFILISSVALGAIAHPAANSAFSWLRRLLGARPPAAVTAAPPIIERDGGWTLVRCDDHEAFSRWLDRDTDGLPPGPDEEPSLGSHLLVEMYGCDPRCLESEGDVGRAMHDAARESEATVVAHSFHEFQPYGVSGAVIIQESHYTIHTWPEHGYAAVDLFYCGGTVRVHRALDVLRERFRPERIKFLVVRRGLQSEVER